MGAVWARSRTDLRRRWRGTVVLALLVGLAGGVVVAAVAGARRTDSSMDRFLEYHRTLDIDVGGRFIAYNRPLDLRVDEDLDLGAVARLPMVADYDRTSIMAMSPSTPAGAPDTAATGSIVPFVSERGHTWTTSNRPILVAGRHPDPEEPLEIAVDESLAEKRGLGPGDTLRLWAFTFRQFAVVGGPRGVVVPPEGASFDFTITGVERQPYDLSPVPVDQDVIYLGTDFAYLTPAFWRAHSRDVANFGLGGLEVRLRGGRAGQADVDELTAAVRRLPGGEDAFVGRGSGAELTAARAQRAIDVEAGALVVFAALAALAALVVLGQTVARQARLDAGDSRTLQAVGMTKPQLLGVALVRTVVVGAAGALVAVALAALASPLFPIGLARRAEIDPGFSLDAPVLVLGALWMLAVVPARAALATLAAVRKEGARPVRAAPRSRVARELARAGAPSSMVAGARLALDPGRGRVRVPVHTAIVSVTVAIAAVAASLTFAASLDRLVGSSGRQGWQWDVVVGNANHGGDITAVGTPLLAANPLVGGFTAKAHAPEPVSIDGLEVPATGLDLIEGAVGPRVLEGRATGAADEIVLGRSTLERLGREVGDVVDVTAGGRRRPMRVVGAALLSPSLNDKEMTMGSGAVMTLEGLRALLPASTPSQFIVDYEPEADPEEAFASVQADFGRTVLRPVPPDDVENLARVEGLPAVLAALLALLGVAALAHTLVASARRHRRDLAVVKALGWVRRQVRATVAWQATIIVGVGLAAGLPLGVAAGRWAWAQVNLDLRSLADPFTPVLAVLAAIPLVVLAANLVAAVPARAASRTHAASALRGE